MIKVILIALYKVRPKLGAITHVKMMFIKTRVGMSGYPRGVRAPFPHLTPTTHHPHPRNSNVSEWRLVEVSVTPALIVGGGAASL